MARREFQSFEDARTFVRTLGLKNVAEWKAYCRSGNKSKDIPANPARTYGPLFIGLGDWLGTGTLAPQVKAKRFRPLLEARAFVHTLKLRSKTEWANYCKSKKLPSDIPKDPPSTYRTAFPGWGDWLGTGNVRPQDRPRRPFLQARAFARELGLKSRDAWLLFTKSKKMPVDIPKDPPTAYSGEFLGWGDWLGTGNISPQEKSQAYRPFQDARAFVHSLRLTSISEWKSYAKTGQRPSDIPMSPWQTYGSEFRGIRDWLGTPKPLRPKRYAPFREARTYARSLGLTNRDAWVVFARSPARPKHIPADPRGTYGAEFVGFGDWLGSGNVSPQEKSRAFRSFPDARTFARTLTLQSKTAWAIHCKSGLLPADIPKDPPSAYGKAFEGWGDWLGTGTIANHRRSYRAFAEARTLARSLGLVTSYDWSIWSKSDAKPFDVPASPDEVYKAQGWSGWSDWLGSDPDNRRQRRRKVWRPFKEARAYIHSLGLKNLQEWRAFAASNKRPRDIPANLRQVYRDEFTTLGDWLGTGTIAPQNRKYRPFAEARAFVHTLKLTGKEDWTRYATSGAKPTDIPGSPSNTYKPDFVGWGDWLGTGTISPALRTYRTFADARAFVHTLKLAGKDDWTRYAKSAEKPADIPANPANAYGSEYKGFGDWLGVVNKWTLAALRQFVSSLEPHLRSLNPGELWLIFQQTHALDAGGLGQRAFIRSLMSGRLPPEEVARFAHNEPSAADGILGDGDTSATSEPDDDVRADDEVADRVVVGDQAYDDLSVDPGTLPSVSVPDILNALSAATSHASDPEAIEFLIASGKAKLWRKVFGADATEAAVVSEVRAFSGRGYADTVRTTFLHEYDDARTMPIPTAYAFMLPGTHIVTEPNLMQRLVASRMRREKRMGNWSGTGTGKTNAAILTSRVVGAKVTVVCCPNSVVEGWVNAVREMFPDSIVASKTFEPDWHQANNHLYLVLNYEMFQQPGAEARVGALVDEHEIDFVVIDEIQFVKQRSENLSRRREMVGAMLTLAADKNPDLHVLGLSATPAINNLREPIALIEMVTGTDHGDLETRPTVPNCMRVYQRLTTLGPRWKMDLKTGFSQREIPVDCSRFIDEIRSLGRRGTPLQLEEILTKARLPTILDAIVPKTLVYTHYIGGTERLDRQLYDAITAKGWRTGFFTGEAKSGLEAFLEGDLDVLIGSSAISTGVDRLQHVCNRLIINVLPWTASEFEQLIGRIHRQGQKRNVEVIIPITRADVNGQEWSWCQAKMQRLRFKKSVADAAVDGVVPEGHLRSQEKAYQDLMAWLERLAGGEVAEVERPLITFTLPDHAEPLDKRRASFGDFSRMNARWNRASSATTHERLLKSPAEWQHYHDELTRVRVDWPADPQEEFLGWAAHRTDLVIGDFGCGRAKVRASLADRHVVHSFDHLAVNEDVVACDMAHVPLEDEMLDVALFCLSLMGSNATEYVREAQRTLKLDGWLHIYEPTYRFSDREAFVKSLRSLGFGNVEVRDVGAFTHISARKTEHRPRLDATLGGFA